MVGTAQLVFGLYLLGVLAIGVYASRFTEHRPTDFYVADRSVGTVVLALTLAATVLSAFTVFGIGASTATGGLGTFTFLAIAAVLYPIFFATVGVALMQVGREREILTPSEYVRARYDSLELGVLYLSVTGVFIIALVAGQLIGGGVALEALLDIGYVPAVLLMATFMLVYIHIAGYRGVIWSDSVQSAVLFVVLAGVVGYVLFSLGSADGAVLAEEAAAETDGLFELAGPAGVWTPLFIVTAAIAFGFGVPGYPHTIQRYFSAANADVMRRSGFVFALVAIPIYLFGAILGVWSVGVLDLETIDNTDHVIPLLVETLFNPVVFGVVIAGATAAIMSTADSALLTMSSMLSRDVYVRYVEPDAGPRREVRVTQAILVGLVVLAVSLALLQPAGIFALIAFAVVGFATTSAPVFLGVYWDRGTTVASGASLVFGPTITILLFVGWLPGWLTFGAHYGFVGVLVAYGVYVGVSLATSAPVAESVAAHSRRFWNRAD